MLKICIEIPMNIVNTRRSSEGIVCNDHAWIYTNHHIYIL